MLHKHHKHEFVRKQIFPMRKKKKKVSSESSMATYHCTVSKSWLCFMSATEVKRFSNSRRQKLKCVAY